MHFWMKRHEICTQIEGWIAELAKLQLAERVDRSLVLRRQYRQLREELAKLPIPQGLEDMDTPFSATVGMPATAAGSSGSTTTTSASTVDSSTTASVITSTITPTESNGSDSSDFINITQLNASDANMNDVENDHPHGLG